MARALIDPVESNPVEPTTNAAIDFTVDRWPAYIYLVFFSAVPLKVEEAQLDSRIDFGSLIVEMGKPL